MLEIKDKSGNFVKIDRNSLDLPFEYKRITSTLITEKDGIITVSDINLYDYDYLIFNFRYLTAYQRMATGIVKIPERNSGITQLQVGIADTNGDLVNIVITNIVSSGFRYSLSGTEFTYVQGLDSIYVLKLQ